MCTLSLPLTNYWTHSQNPMFDALHSRTGIQHASAFLFFERFNVTQRMMHRLKYRGDKEIGQILGRLFARELQSTQVFADLDLIIPVPLHPSKLLKRGYNQSTQISIGISEVAGVPVMEESLQRGRSGQSQTKKSRYERWEGIQDNFFLSPNIDLTNKHILLVDDVFTTGATLESCIRTIKEGNCNKISVTTLACSDY